MSVSTWGAATGTQSRITTAFARCRNEERAALIPFLTAGYPTLDASCRLLGAIAAGGADLIEIGIPFSDPLADGVTVQRASQISLDQGTTLSDAIQLVAEARSNGIEVPIVFMGYANPFLQHGIDQLAADAERVGIDGFIIPDLPIEESDEFLLPLRRHGRDLIFMVAPTSTAARIGEVADRASGFVYCVSLTGVTGARAELSKQLPAYLDRVREQVEIPIAVGFGISTPEQVRTVAAMADGVVVASALINYLDTLSNEELEAGATGFVRRFVAATSKSQLDQNQHDRK